MSVFSKFLLIFALMVGFAGIVKADPVRIHTGRIVTSDTSGVTNVFVGMSSDTIGFNFTGRVSNGIYPIGSSFNVGTVLPSTINILQRTFGGTGGENTGYIFFPPEFQLYGNIFFPNTPPNFLNLTFTQPVIVPNFSGNSFSLTVPFTMQGILQVSCAENSPFSNCTSAMNNTYSIYGSGNAELYFVNNPDGKVSYRIATYDFSTPEPTPEPATILLLGTGLAGIFSYARRRKKLKQTE